VASIELICESCGTGNPPGTEFCHFCGTYLAWDRSVVVRPQTGGPPSRGPSGYPPGQTPAQPPRQPMRPPGSGAPPTAPTGGAGIDQPWLEAARLKNPRPRAVQPAPVQHSDPPTVPISLPTAAQFSPSAPPRGPAPRAQPYGMPSPGGYAPMQPVPGGPCPRCGRVNDAQLRFCGKCGLVLIADQTGVAGGAGRQARPKGWWQRLWDSHDRAARRAYRRSLPPLYRWRRVLIAILLLGLGIGGLYALRQHPLRWVIERWYDLFNTTNVVTGVTAKVNPPQATAAGSEPAALTDTSKASWSMTWKPKQEGESCGGAPGTGVILLTIPDATRVREIDIAAGLPVDDPARQLQFRPKSIGIRFDGGDCRSFPLENAAGEQPIKVDSEVPVQTIQIGVDTTYAAPADGQPLLSITEVRVKSRPHGPG
jgi:hypothetical protein